MPAGSTGAPTAVASPPPQTYPIGLVSSTAGLEQLASYRLNLIVDFEGMRNGQPAAGHIEWLTEVNQPANLQHHYLYSDAAFSAAENLTGISEFFRAGNKVYVSKANGETFSLDTDTLPNLSATEVGLPELTNLMVLPAAVTTPPITETVRGLPAQRFTFTEADLTSGALVFESARGDLWLAEAGGYLMQYIISATVTVAAPIPNAHILDNGRLNLSYTLADVNTDFEIKIPDSLDTAITPLAQFPRPDDAQVTAIFPALLEYTTAISPISATLFYQAGLPPNGWTEDSAEIFEEKSRLVYSKENQTLIITVAPTGRRNQIKVLLNLDIQP